MNKSSGVSEVNRKSLAFTNSKFHFSTPKTLFISKRLYSLVNIIF